METEFLLSVKGVQRHDQEEPQVIELTTEASLTGEDGVLYLRYAESALTGLEGTVTCFELHQNKVVLRRTGSVRSEMVFIPGQVHESLYDTEQGALLITIRTLELEDEMTLEGGSLHVGYSISIEGLGMGQIDYYLNVRRREPARADPREDKEREK